MEKLDLYDMHKIKTGRTIFRGEKVPKGLYRLVVHICIFNSKGEMLIQKRSDTKKFWPSLWDVSVGGCVSAGETSQEGITREIKEELGIDIEIGDLRPAITFAFEEGYDDVYLIQKDIDLSKVTLQKEEVSEVKYASLEEIKKLEKNHKFISFQRYLLEFLFEMNGKENIFTE